MKRCGDCRFGVPLTPQEYPDVEGEEEEEEEEGDGDEIQPHAHDHFQQYQQHQQHQHHLHGNGVPNLFASMFGQQVMPGAPPGQNPLHQLPNFLQFVVPGPSSLPFFSFRGWILPSFLFCLCLSGRSDDCPGGMCVVCVCVGILPRNCEDVLLSL